MANLANGVVVTVAPPSRPAASIAPPSTAPGVLVVPVPGPRGPAGQTGGAAFTYVQGAPTATWTVTHTLGRRPTAVLITVGTTLVDTDVELPDTTTVVLTFALPTAGRVDLL